MKAIWFALGCLLAGCAPKAHEQLIVGMELAYPPFEMTDQHGHPTGVSVDLARDLGKYLRREHRRRGLSVNTLLTFEVVSPSFDRFAAVIPPAIEGEMHPRRVIRPRPVEDFPAMKRSLGAAGFGGQSSSLASSRLTDAVAAALALAAISLCLVTALSIKVGMALAFPL